MRADSAACWAVALWCGVAHRLIRERLVAEAMPTGQPYTPRARKADAACIRQAMTSNQYLQKAGQEALDLLGCNP